MAKASTIVLQLRNIMPRLTNLFTLEVAVDSLTRSGSTVTGVTLTPHGLANGQVIHIAGAKAPVLVTELTQTDNVAHGLVDLSTPHDLTEGYQETIEITGADQAAYNGAALPLLSVPNRYEFTYQISGDPASPATGSPILLFDGKARGYDGQFIVTVVDANTFTYTITEEPYEQAYGTIKLVTGSRITAAIDIERAIQTYTEQETNEFWGWVVLNHTDISKDRFTLSDATALVQPGSQVYLWELQRVSFYVIAPTVNELAGARVMDQMQDIRSFLYKALLLFSVPTGLSANDQKFGIAPVGHRPYKYLKAYYVHEFEFEILSIIVNSDGLPPDVNVAFRDIFMTLNRNNPNQPMTLGVNLDDEPYQD